MAYHDAFVLVDRDPSWLVGVVVVEEDVAFDASTSSVV
jgi:hypothetical protein